MIEITLRSRAGCSLASILKQLLGFKSLPSSWSPSQFLFWSWLETLPPYFRNNWTSTPRKFSITGKEIIIFFPLLFGQKTMTKSSPIGISVHTLNGCEIAVLKGGTESIISSRHFFTAFSVWLNPLKKSNALLWGLRKADCWCRVQVEVLPAWPLCLWVLPSVASCCDLVHFIARCAGFLYFSSWWLSGTYWSQNQDQVNSLSLKILFIKHHQAHSFKLRKIIFKQKIVYHKRKCNLNPCTGGYFCSFRVNLELYLTTHLSEMNNQLWNSQVILTIKQHQNTHIKATCCYCIFLLFYRILACGREGIVCLSLSFL